MAKPRTRAALYPHHVQTRIDPELQRAIETLTDSTDTPGIRHRRGLRALYELALTSPDCPPALYSALAAHRPGRWVSLHNTRPDIRSRMAGAELLPPQYAAMVAPAAAAPGALAALDALDALDTDQTPPQQPDTPEPLHDTAAAAPAPAAAAPGHRRPKMDRLGRPVTVQTRPLTDAELQQEGARVTALALAEATGQPLPPFELMPWERIVYEGEQI